MASGDREKFSGHLESDAKDPPDAPRPRETFRCGLSVENSDFVGVASMAWRWSRHAIERHRDNIPSMAWGLTRFSRATKCGDCREWWRWRRHTPSSRHNTQRTRNTWTTRRPEVTAKAKARPARTADAQSRIDAARRQAATKRVEASLAARRAREETFRPRLNHQTSRSWEDVKPRLLAPSRRARDATRAPKRDDDLEACSFRPHLVAQCPAYIHAMADASRASKRAEPAPPPPPKPMFFHGRD